MIQTQENSTKPHLGPNFGPNLGCQFFFFQKYDFIKHYISWSAIIMYNIRKTNDSILRKFSDGQTDRQIVTSKDTVQLMLSVQHCYTKNISRK